MAEFTTIPVTGRAAPGTGPARAARREGYVPGIIYGAGEDPVMITLERRAVIREMNRPGFFGRLFDLELDGSKIRALPRDLQRHPVTGLPMHVDFLRVVAGTPVRLSVKVTFKGAERSPGLREGGVLNVVRHAIEMHCDPELIPESIVVDLAGAKIGESIHISSVSLPEGAKPTIVGRDFTIATIAPPSGRAERAAAGRS